jgi:hypothetical protein
LTWRLLQAQPGGGDPRSAQPQRLQERQVQRSRFRRAGSEDGRRSPGSWIDPLAPIAGRGGGARPSPRGNSADEIAARLDGQITSAEISEWSRGVPLTRAMESFQLAKRDAYALSDRPTKRARRLWLCRNPPKFLSEPEMKERAAEVRRIRSRRLANGAGPARRFPPIVPHEPRLAARPNRAARKVLRLQEKMARPERFERPTLRFVGVQTEVNQRARWVI